MRPMRRRLALAMRDQQAGPHVPRVRLEIYDAGRHATRPEDRFEVALQTIDVDYGVHAQTVPSMVAP
jgi:hypothetical protein